MEPSDGNGEVMCQTFPILLLIEMCFPVQETCGSISYLWLAQGSHWIYQAGDGFMGQCKLSCFRDVVEG